jgi:hypothetical protein
MRLGHVAVGAGAEDLDLVALGSGAARQVPRPVMLALHREEAVIRWLPAHQLQELLELGAVGTERLLLELAREVEAGRVDLVHVVWLQALPRGRA